MDQNPELFAGLAQVFVDPHMNQSVNPMFWAKVAQLEAHLYWKDIFLMTSFAVCKASHLQGDATTRTLRNLFGLQFFRMIRSPNKGPVKTKETDLQTGHWFPQMLRG